MRGSRTAAGVLLVLLLALPTLPTVDEPSRASVPRPITDLGHSIEAVAARPAAIPPALPPIGTSQGDQWTNLTQPFGPPPRGEAQITYDGGWTATILFGGRAPDGTALNDTWAYRNGSWANWTGTVGAAPAARWGAAVAYDAALGAIVLFGGRNGTTFFGDTWTLGASGWLPMPMAKAPSPRTSSAAYDTRSGNLYVFGGGFRSLGPTPGPWVGYNDTWLLRPTSWLNETANFGPGPNASGTVVYDDGDRVTLLLGGNPSHNHLWALARGKWREVFAAGTPSLADLNESAAAYDPVGGFVLYVAGGNGTPVAGTTWAFRAGLWTNLSGNLSRAPPAASNLSLAGGSDNSSAILVEGDPATSTGAARNETWGFSGVPFQVRFSVTPGATDTQQPVVLGDTLNETVGSGFVYSYRYGQLPSGCVTGNLSLLPCVPITSGLFVLNTTVTRSDGATVNLTAMLTVHLPPTAQLAGPSQGDPAELLTFAGSVLNGTGPFVMNWTFGDGSSGNGSNVSHAFAVPGVYDVSLTVRDAVGSGSQVTDPVTVHPTLGLQLSANRTATDAGVPVGFTATPIGGAAPYGIVWHWPGGATAAGATASRSFPTVGLVNVSATVTDAVGAVQWANLSLTVAPGPSLTLAVSTALADVGGPIGFDATAHGGIPPYRVTWRFSDGGSAVGANASHRFPTAGPAWGQATLVDAAGVAVSAAAMVTVNADPSVAIAVEATSGCLPSLAVTFDGEPSGGSAPYALRWSFGDGAANGSGPSPTHIFAAVGRFTVVVEVEDALGVTANASLNVTAAVCPPPARSDGNATGSFWTIPEEIGLVALAAAGTIGAALWIRRRRPPAPSDGATDDPPTGSMASAPAGEAPPPWSEEEAPSDPPPEAR